MSSDRRRGVTLTAGMIGVATLILVSVVGSFFTEPPATPTNYRSMITDISPRPQGVAFGIEGGDAYLAVSVAPGHTIEMRGYFDEAYIRIDERGGVWVNTDSPAFYINQSRWGETAVPPGVESADPPSWTRVRDDGTYAWHDHRTHWMSIDRPPTVAGDVPQTIFPWNVPSVVDGLETSIEGELNWDPPRSAIAPLMAGMIALLPAVVLGLSSVGATTLTAITGSAVALGVSVARALALPASVPNWPREILLPVAAILALAVFITARKGRPSIWRWAMGAAALSLALWWLGTVSSLWAPTLPSSLPTALEAAAVAFVVWSSIVLVLAGSRGVLEASRTRAGNPS